MTSHREFGSLTSGTEVAETFREEIKNRIIVITGVSPESLGGTLSTILARHGPQHLILASRTKSKLNQVVDEIKQSHPQINVDAVQLDLSSQASIREAAKEISTLTSRIDLLINNAAIMDPDHHYTQEGIEMQFGTNYIGHFLFTNLLLPQLRAAAQNSPRGSTRIVNVSSHGHRLSPVRFHDYNFEGKAIPDEEEPPSWVPDQFRPGHDRPYSGFLSYGQCKTANILFSVALTERLQEEGIVSYAIHPGSIHTGLSRNLSPEDEAIIEKTGAQWITHDQGTSTILVAALNPALNDARTGVYLSDCHFAKASSHATDPELAARLWTLSEELTKETEGGARL